MHPLRILVLAPDSNPESITTSLIGYLHSAALAKLHRVTLVIRRAHEDAVRRAQASFHAIESVSLSRLDRFAFWAIRRIFKYNFGSQAYTAFNYPFAVAFEWQAWRQLRGRIMSGEFDVVVRLLPITPVLPSPFSFFLRRGPIPFVIGPLNGGLPWPRGFSQGDRQREWVSGLRPLYRLLPFGKSTYKYATAIVAGSSHTFTDLSLYGDKVFYLPENGISIATHSNGSYQRTSTTTLELVFVGRLVPYKACDLALRGAASLLQAGAAHFTVVGDGPEKARLEQLTRSLGIEGAVDFCGWLSHSETLRRLRRADVLVFPSIREFGGGVVFEGLAVGAVPVVADFGGPGDIVDPSIGRKVVLTNEADVVVQLQNELHSLARDRDVLERLRQAGMSYARERLTWEAKAKVMTDILNWSVRRGPKPSYPPPKPLPSVAR